MNLLFLNSFWFFAFFCASLNDISHASSGQPPPLESNQTNNFSEQEILLTQAEEEYLSDGIFADIQKDFPIVQNPIVQSYVSFIGSKLIQANNLEGNPYTFHFYVVESPSLNAFSIPGGTVFISKTLLVSLLNEAQLTGVLSHEIAHISQQHTAKRMLRIKNQSSQNSILLFGGTLGGSVVGYGLGKINCPKKDELCARRASLIGGNLGYLGAQLFEKYQFLAHSQNEELEADRIGLQISAKAGYDFQSTLSYLDPLNSTTVNRSPSVGSDLPYQLVQDLLISHPFGETRSKTLMQIAKELGPSPKVQFGPDRLLPIKNLLTLGLQNFLEPVSKVNSKNRTIKKRSSNDRAKSIPEQN